MQKSKLLARFLKKYQQMRALETQKVSDNQKDVNINTPISAFSIKV